MDVGSAAGRDEGSTAQTVGKSQGDRDRLKTAAECRAAGDQAQFLGAWKAAEYWWLRGAEMDDVESMVRLGRQYLKGGVLKGGALKSAEGVRWLTRAAGRNSGAAIEALIEHYLFKDKNDRQALAWIRRASPEGTSDRGLRFRQAEILIEGHNRPESPRDIPRGLALLRKLAEDGFEAAQLTLASHHLKGFEAGGIDKDWLECERWLLRAVDGGSQAALDTLVRYYGMGTSHAVEARAPHKVAPLLQRRAEAGMAYACSYLAICHIRGLFDVPRDAAKGAVWYERAAEAGDVAAQYELFNIFRDGRGVSEDSVKAFQWLLRAANSGLIEARIDLALALAQGTGFEKNEARAFALLQEAAAEGDANAKSHVASFLLHGVGTTEDVAKGMALLEQAAQEESGEALYLLGLMHIQGQGVAPDDVKGWTYMHRAAQAGHGLAVVLMEQTWKTKLQEVRDPPAAAAAYLEHAWELFDLGDLDSAAAAIERSIELDDAAPRALLMRGILLYRLHDYGEAARGFERYESATGGAEPLSRLLCWAARSRAGQPVEARDALEAYWSAHADSLRDSFHKSALAYVLDKTDEDALRTAAAANGPAHVLFAAEFFIGTKALLAGDQDSATARFRACIALEHEQVIEYQLALAELEAKIKQ